MTNKRGRPPKWEPQIIAGWRYARNATVAQAAKKWMVSEDTVKRACRKHSPADALAARHAWFDDQWSVVMDRLLFVFEKRGGYAPVVANLKGRLMMLEAGQRENEQAMTRLDVPFRPSIICAQAPESEASKEDRRWRTVLEMDEDDQDDGPWELTPWQERQLFGGGA